MLKDILTNATGSVIGAVIVAILGIGAVTSTVVVIRSGGRFGKNIMIVAVLIFLGGMYYAGEHNAPPEVGIGIIIFCFILYKVGKFINWY